jgi:hypothetical protein
MADPARLSALVYTAISLAAAALFLLATYAAAVAYPPVARFGGTVWVFILSMIITMPIIIPFLNKRQRR